MAAPSLTVFANNATAVTADQLNTFMQTCDNAAQMRGLTGVTGMSLFARGINSINDGLGGAFYWNVTSAGPDDGINTIVPYGARVGAWCRESMPTGYFVVPNIAALRALSGGSSYPMVAIEGYTTGADGGEGVFWYDAADTTSADNGGTIIVDAQNHRYYRQTNGEPYSVYWFGAFGNGTTDDTTAILNTTTAAEYAARSVVFPTSNGGFKITANLTLQTPTAMNFGAVINVPTGVTVNFSQGVTAGVWHIFSCTGTGAVTINPNYTLTGYPEWWGCVVDTSAAATTNAAAINACLVAMIDTELHAGDYWIASTVVHNLPNHRFRGAGSRYAGVSDVATRLLITSGTLPTIQMGPSTEPTGGINYFPQNLRLEDMTVTRSIVPVIASAPSGVVISYVQVAYVTRIQSSESCYGFNIGGTVDLYLRDCYAFRSFAGSGTGSDLFWGFYAYGFDTIGAAGSNASLYFEDCNTSLGGLTIANGNGFVLNGNFTDTYLVDCSVSEVNTGIALLGNGNNGTTNDTGNADVHIINAVVDAFTFAGIYIYNCNKYGGISITSGYTAPIGGANNGACVNVTGSFSAVSIQGMQHYLASDATCKGLYITGSTNVMARGNSYNECASYPVLLTAAQHCCIEDLIKSFSVIANQAAVTLTGACARNYLSVIVEGQTGAFTYGYNAQGSGTGYNEFHCTGLDPACIVGTSNNKLVINGTQVTTVGLSGTNYASGVMA